MKNHTESDFESVDVMKLGLRKLRGEQIHALLNFPVNTNTMETISNQKQGNSHQLESLELVTM